MPSRGPRVGIRITHNNGRLGARCFSVLPFLICNQTAPYSGNPSDCTLIRLHLALDDRHIAKAFSSLYGRALCLVRASTDSAQANRADVNHLEAT
jgi:hypothetical protein